MQLLVHFFDFLWQLEVDPAIHLLWCRVPGACSSKVALPADLDGDLHGVFSSVPHPSSLSALSFLPFLDLWPDFLLLFAPRSLDAFRSLFLVHLLRALTIWEVFLHLLHGGHCKLQTFPTQKAAPVVSDDDVIQK